MNDKTKKGLIVAVMVILIAIATAVVLYPHDIEVSWEGEGEVTPDGGSIRFYESLDLRVEPEEGWTVGTVTIGGEEVSLEGTTYSLKVSAFSFSTIRIHVVFVKDEQPETHIVTVSSTDGGAISPSGAVEVLNGGSVSFSIMPDYGYELDSLKVDGERVASGVSSYVLSDVRKDMTVHAVFKRGSSPGPTPQPEKYTVTASASEGGSISPSGSTIVTEGGTITFTMSPDTGYALSKLLVDDEPVTVVGNTYTLQNIRADHLVHALFERSEPPEPGTHSVTITSTANGTMTPFGTIHVTDGEDLTLTITPDEGYRLESLTVDGIHVTSDVGTYTLRNVTSDHEVHAIFVMMPVEGHTVTATASKGGSISPSGTIYVEDGEDLTFTITPDSGYRISSITVDGDTVEPQDGTYTLRNVTSDHEVHVEFEIVPAPVTHMVTITHTGNGTVTPTGIVIVSDGDDLAIIMTPNEGNHISSVLVDGDPVEPEEGKYTLRNVTSDHTVTISFEKDGPLTHTVTATASEGGSIDPSGTITVTDGGQISFTITADEGYRLSQLLVDGMSVTVSDSTYTLSDVTGDHIIRAEFVEVLDRIEITSEPIMKVYTVGDTFDPTGMTVTAFYTDGTSRNLDPSEYTYEPSGALAPEHTSIVVTYQGKTDSVDISVADPDDFNIIVTHYEGTRMENGKKVSFSEDLRIPLDEFSFDTQNISPNTKQTMTMVVTNGTGMQLAASVFVADPDISEGMGLAEQLTLSITSDSGTYTASVVDVTSGTVLPLGTLSPGGSVTVSVTLDFPESDHNNEAMDQKVSFGLGVLAGQEAAST